MSCVICQHAKIVAIDAAIDEKRLPAVVARQFRLNPVALTEHIAHRTVDECVCDWCRLPGYPRLLRAWQEANNQEKERFCYDTRTMDVPF